MNGQTFSQNPHMQRKEATISQFTQRGNIFDQGHRYGGRRVAKCAEPAWKCHTASTEYSSHKLLPVLYCCEWIVKSGRQSQSCHWEWKIRSSFAKVLLVVMWGLWTCILRFVSWICPTCSDQQLGLVQYDHHAIIWTSQSPADILQLSTCVNVKFIHADHSECEMLIPPDLSMGVLNTKSEPIAAVADSSLSIYLCPGLVCLSGS